MATFIHSVDLSSTEQSHHKNAHLIVIVVVTVIQLAVTLACINARAHLRQGASGATTCHGAWFNGRQPTRRAVP
jgi:hypothetical protein